MNKNKQNNLQSPPPDLDVYESLEINSKLDKEARELRDKVYGQKSSDSNWDGCRENWIKNDLDWLKKMAAKNK